MAFTEDLFQAIKTIAEGLDDQIKKDTTILCEIVNNTEASNGKYEVQYQQARFEAFSENTSYPIGAMVYVVIPMGNYDEKKIILGRKVSDTTAPFNWISPFNSFFQMKEIFNSENAYGLIANGEVASNTIGQSVATLYGYDRIGIKAGFRTALSDCIAGEYGVRLILTTNVLTGISDEQEEIILDLGVLDMWGDPYNFPTYFKQEKVFALEPNITINNWRLEFYQNQNFMTGDGEVYPVEGVVFGDPVPNLFVDDIEISVGYSIDTSKTDKVYLYAVNGANYNAYQTKPSIVNDIDNYNTIVKTVSGDDSAIDPGKIGILFPVIQPMANRIGVNALSGPIDIGDYGDILENIIDTKQFQVRWWHITESGAGVAIDENQEFKNLVKENESPIYVALYRYNKDIRDMTLVGRQYELVDEPHSSATSETPLDFSYSPDYNQPEEKLKAVIYRLKELNEPKIVKSTTPIELIESDKVKYEVEFKYISDEFILTNSNEVSDEENTALTISPQDNYQGKYNIYQTDSWKIIDENESNMLRKCHLNFKSNNLRLNFLDKADSIVWKFPIKDTMLRFIVDEENVNIKSEDNDSGYVSYRYLNYINQQIKEDGSAQYSIDDMVSEILNPGYYINNYYATGLSNNTIYCQVIRDGYEYNTSFTFTFGLKDTESTGNIVFASLGDEYETIDGEIILKEKNVNAWTIGETEQIHLNCKIYNANGEEIPATNWIFNHYAGEELFDINNLILTKKDNASIGADNNGEIFKISTIQNEITYTSYLIIPLRTDRSILSISGPTEIIYNSQGLNPKGYQNYFRQLLAGENSFTSPNSVESIGENALTCLPSCIKRGNNYYLKPSSLWLSNITSYNYGVKIKIEEDKFWYQPILIYAQSLKDTILNDWNGELQISQGENRVLAATIGAGWQDNGKFTGAIMGTVLSSGSEKTAENTGLFGYHQGEESFAFKSDGTAFIGKAGQNNGGQIIFDGTSGVIKSGNYIEGAQGSCWDLDDGKFETSNGIFRGEIHATSGTFGNLELGDDGKVVVELDDQLVAITATPIDVITGFTGVYQVAPQETPVTVPVSQTVYSSIVSANADEPENGPEGDDWIYIGYLMNGTNYVHAYKRTETTDVPTTVTINVVDGIVLTPIMQKANVLSINGIPYEGEDIVIEIDDGE